MQLLRRYSIYFLKFSLARFRLIIALGKLILVRIPILFRFLRASSIWNLEDLKSNIFCFEEEY